jgi:hypothetical protein
MTADADRRGGLRFGPMRHSTAIAARVAVLALGAHEGSAVASMSTTDAARSRRHADHLIVTARLDTNLRKE